MAATLLNSSRALKVSVDATRAFVTLRKLADLYGVPTKALNQAVKRNLWRFPGDFMFGLTVAEKVEAVTNCDRLNQFKFSKATLPFGTPNGSLEQLLGSSQTIRDQGKLFEYVVSGLEQSNSPSPNSRLNCEFASFRLLCSLILLSNRGATGCGIGND
jgi:ORF6N domain